MENIRVILAAASAVIGVLLLIAFLIRLRRPQPGNTSWVLGILFLATAAILWLRGGDTEHVTEVQTEPVPTEVDSLEAAPESGGIGTGSSGTVSGDEPSPAKPRSAETGRTSTQREVAARDANRGTDRRSPVPRERRADRQRQVSSQRELTLEDRIFAAIEASFDWIEEIFEKYGTEIPATSTPEPSQRAVARAPAIEFPDVRFEEESADLTLQSQNELKILATRLLTEYPSGVLEIQAYVDSVGPEAYNYVLTQARADAVRDLLVAEGISEDRLIARGYGTQGRDPDLAAARIEFVVHH